MNENAGLVERLERAKEVVVGFCGSFKSDRCFSDFEDKAVDRECAQATDAIDEAAQRIRELEAALAAETERCARLADGLQYAARSERDGELATSVGKTGAICLSTGSESTAKAIAAAIRAGAPK
jgi:hypothetical protein